MQAPFPSSCAGKPAVLLGMRAQRDRGRRSRACQARIQRKAGFITSAAYGITSGFSSQLINASYFLRAEGDSGALQCALCFRLPAQR